jgi:hypothetical protein
MYIRYDDISISWVWLNKVGIKAKKSIYGSKKLKVLKVEKGEENGFGNSHVFKSTKVHYIRISFHI